MRHLIGLILALTLAVALFLAGGWGAEHFAAVAAHRTGLPGRTGVIGLAAMAGTGLFLGILLAVPAISPLATGLPGLVLLGWTALLALSPHRALAWIPLQGYAFGAGFRVLLLTGTLALLGSVMIVPLFLPSRWRSAAADDDLEVIEVPEPTELLQ
jgi:hypothetical protein